MSAVPWILLYVVDGEERRVRYATEQAATSGVSDLVEFLPSVTFHLCHEDGRPPRRLHPIVTEGRLSAVAWEVTKNNHDWSRTSSVSPKCPAHGVPVTADKECEACTLEASLGNLGNEGV